MRARLFLRCLLLRRLGEINSISFLKKEIEGQTMFSRIFGAALRGARSAAASKALKVQNNGGLLEQSIVQGFKPDFTSNRSISSMILARGIQETVQKSLIAPAGTLLRKTNEANVLKGYVPVRTVIKYTMAKGKRQTVKAVVNRFYRLNWGIWIRTIAGRHRRRWRKRASNARRSRQHVFCNATQSWLLDKMVSPYWRKPKYWVDDPYNPYHTREEYWKTRTKPMEWD